MARLTQAGPLAGRESVTDELAKLWQEHRRWVAVVLLAHRPPGVELDDLLQEVALTLIRRYGDLRDRSRIRPWLRAIAINRAREMRRRQLGPAQGPARDGIELVGEIDRSLERLELQEQTRLVLRRALELPRELREPLLLRSLHGLSQKQIATTLELNETTVESRIARARRLLRERTIARPVRMTARANGGNEHASN